MKVYNAFVGVFVSVSKGHVPYLFLFLPQSIPHGRHDLGHVSEGGVGVLAFNGRLCVSEEQGVGRHGLLRLVGVLLLFAFLPYSSAKPHSSSQCGWLAPPSPHHNWGARGGGDEGRARLGRHMGQDRRRDRQRHGRVYQYTLQGQSVRDEGQEERSRVEEGWPR